MHVPGGIAEPNVRLRSVEPQPIFALDLSTHTGFAVGVPFAKPAWGTWHLGSTADGSHGRRLSCLANELETAIAFHQPARVVFEAPLVQNDRAARLLMYLAGVVELICFEAGVRCFEANVMSVRKLVLGHGRPVSPDPKRPKLPMIRWCEQQGWAVGDDDNAADALILLQYAHLLARSRVTAGAGSVAA